MAKVGPERQRQGPRRMTEWFLPRPTSPAQMGIHARVGGGSRVEPLLAFSIRIPRDQMTESGGGPGCSQGRTA